MNTHVYPTPHPCVSNTIQHVDPPPHKGSPSQGRRGPPSRIHSRGRAPPVLSSADRARSLAREHPELFLSLELVDGGTDAKAVLNQAYMRTLLIDIAHELLRLTTPLSATDTDQVPGDVPTSDTQQEIQQQQQEVPTSDTQQQQQPMPLNLDALVRCLSRVRGVEDAVRLALPPPPVPPRRHTRTASGSSFSVGEYTPRRAVPSVPSMGESPLGGLARSATADSTELTSAGVEEYPSPTSGGVGGVGGLVGDGLMGSAGSSTLVGHDGGVALASMPEEGGVADIGEVEAGEDGEKKVGGEKGGEVGGDNSKAAVPAAAAVVAGGVVAAAVGAGVGAWAAFGDDDDSATINSSTIATSGSKGVGGALGGGTTTTAAAAADPWTTTTTTTTNDGAAVAAVPGAPASHTPNTPVDDPWGAPATTKPSVVLEGAASTDPWAAPPPPGPTTPATLASGAYGSGTLGSGDTGANASQTLEKTPVTVPVTAPSFATAAPVTIDPWGVEETVVVGDDMLVDKGFSNDMGSSFAAAQASFVGVEEEEEDVDDDGDMVVIRKNDEDKTTAATATAAGAPVDVVPPPADLQRLSVGSTGTHGRQPSAKIKGLMAAFEGEEENNLNNLNNLNTAEGAAAAANGGVSDAHVPKDDGVANNDVNKEDGDAPAFTEAALAGLVTGVCEGVCEGAYVRVRV